MAQRGQGARSQSGEHVGQLREAGLAGDQARRTPDRAAGPGRAPGGRRSCGSPAGPARRCRPGCCGCSAGRSGTHPPSDSCTARSPYQLSSMTVPSGASRSSDAWPGRRRWRWRAPPDRARSRRPSGRANSTPSAAATPARPGSASTSSTVDPGEPGEQGGDAAADHAGADHGDPIADQRRGVPQRVHRGLHGPGQHRPGGRHPIGYRRPRRRPATTYAVWCG